MCFSVELTSKATALEVFLISIKSFLADLEYKIFEENKA
jgi:hypothetical protein